MEENIEKLEAIIEQLESKMRDVETNLSFPTLRRVTINLRLIIKSRAEYVFKLFLFDPRVFSLDVRSAIDPNGVLGKVYTRVHRARADLSLGRAFLSRA